MRKHKRILAYVNEIRKCLGRKPLKRLLRGGYLSYTCPISLSIYHDCAVFGSYISFGREDDYIAVKSSGFPAHHLKNSISVPEFVNAWIVRFDDGLYPELVAKWANK